MLRKAAPGKLREVKPRWVKSCEHGVSACSQFCICFARIPIQNLTINMPQAQPELKKVRSPQSACKDGFNLLQYVDKKLYVQLNGNRKVIGVLRGYDVRDLPFDFIMFGLLIVGIQVFLNIVLDEAVEERAAGEKVRMGMVVSPTHPIHIQARFLVDVIAIGHSRQFSRHARGTGTHRGWPEAELSDRMRSHCAESRTNLDEPNIPILLLRFWD